jgi:hypothetical protein
MNPELLARMLPRDLSNIVNEYAQEHPPEFLPNLLNVLNKNSLRFQRFFRKEGGKWILKQFNIYDCDEFFNWTLYKYLYDFHRNMTDYITYTDFIERIERDICNPLYNQGFELYARLMNEWNSGLKKKINIKGNDIKIHIYNKWLYVYEERYGTSQRIKYENKRSRN